MDARRQARELALLHRVRSDLATALDLGDLVRRVVEAVAEAFGYSQVSVYLREGDELVLQHQVGYERVLARVPVTKGVSGRVVRSGRPVLVEDVGTDPAFLGAIAGIVSEICVPLRDGERVVGVLNVESTHGVRLSDEDLRLIVALGEHVDLAIAVARLHGEVRASERRFRAIVRDVSDLIAVVAADGAVRYLSPSTERLLGRTPASLVGRGLLALLHPDDAAGARRAFAEWVSNPDSVHRIEARFRHGDGSWRWLEVVGRRGPEVAELGGIVLNARDVTERTVAEAARRRAEERYRRLVDAGFEAIVLHDGRVHLDVNLAHLRMFGYDDRSELIGRPILDLVAPASWEEVLRRTDEGSEDVYEIVALRRDGSTFPVELQGRSIAEGKGRLRVTAVRDISERKAGEEDARREAARLRVSMAASASLDLDVVLSEVARACLGAAGAECCGVELWHPETAELETLAEETVPAWPGVAERGSRYRLADRALQPIVLETRAPMVFATDDRRLSAAERRLYAEEGIGETLLVPLLLGGTCLGLLLLYARRRDTFREREIRVAEELALQAAQAIRNAHQLADARSWAEEQAALLRVSQAAVSGQPLGEVLAEVCRAALGVAGAEACEIERWHPARDEMETLAEETVPDWPGTVVPGERSRSADWPSGWQVLATGETWGFTIDEPALAERERRAYVGYGVGAVLRVPLLLGEERLGILTLYSRHQRPFFERAGRFARDLATQTAQVIERARLVEAEERERRGTAALLRAAAGLNEAGSLEALMPVLAAAAAEAVDAERVLVYAYDEELTRTIAAGRYDAARVGTVPQFPADAATIEAVSPLEVPAEAEVIRSGRPLARDGETPVPPCFPPDDWCSDVVVPLLAAGKTHGVLYARDAGRARVFSAEEVALLQAIGNQGGLAILRARDAAAAERRAGHLGLINQVGRALSDTLEIEELCRRIHAEVGRVLAADAFFVALHEPESDALRFPYLIDDGERCEEEWVPLDGGPTSQVVRTGQPYVRHDVDDPIATAGTRFGAVDRRSTAALYVPMRRGETVIGVLSVQRYDAMGYGVDDVRTLATIAEQAAAAVQRADLLARNRRLYLGSIKALVATVDAKDPYTRGHSERVSGLAGGVARELGLGRAGVEAIELAGLLHDVGKIGVPDAILQKPGALDDAERAIMVGHVTLGAEILSAAGSDDLRAVVPLVRHHHERVDGTGYPDGLGGDQIPLGAAIIGTADAFDTLVTARTYRSATSAAAAVGELRRSAGSHFRPDVVEALVRAVALAEASPGSAVVAGAAGGGAPLAGGTDAPPPAAGQLGDTRGLGLLLELAAVTRHMPDLDLFLRHVVRIVRERLGYEWVCVLLLDAERRELVMARDDGPGAETRLDYRQSVDVGILGWVARTGRARRVADVRREPDFFADWPNPRGSEMAVPLVVGGTTIGVIDIESEEVGAFTAGDEAVLTAVAGQLAAAIHVAQLHDAAKRAAVTDGLTGLANHRAFYEGLEEAAAAEEPFCVILMDVEGLKRVNDSAGHLAGDALLRRVGRVIREDVREEDLVARYGGDEFGVILRGIGREAAAGIASRIRSELRRSGGGIDAAATVRYGVASRPEDGTRPTDLVAAADRRLYRMRDRFPGGGLR